jgi:hypothetical protein
MIVEIKLNKPTLPISLYNTWDITMGNNVVFTNPSPFHYIFKSKII